MKPDMEKIIEVLISLLEEQEKVEITYTIEKTAQAVERWTSSMNLKPETPLIKKLEIKRLEYECENLRLWRWRLTIAIELILITVLGACVVNFYAIR